MNSLTSAIGKNVIAVNSGKIVGTVLSAKFNSTLKSLRYYEIFNDEDGSCFYFSEKAVEGISDAIVLRDENKLIAPDSVTDCINCPINLPVFTNLGKFVGKITDIMLNKSIVVSLCAGDLSFAPSQIRSKSENLVIVNHSILDTDESTESKNRTVALKSSENSNKSSPYSHLLGRKVNTDIFSGETLIIRAGETVNEQTIERAQIGGKLLLLSASAK